jgi:fructose-specific phosphotransferase system component IIB
MTTPQKEIGSEAKLNQTNVASLQAVLTSADLQVNWQQVMEKTDVIRPDNA